MIYWINPQDDRIRNEMYVMLPHGARVFWSHTLWEALLHARGNFFWEARVITAYLNNQPRWIVVYRRGYCANRLDSFTNWACEQTGTRADSLNGDEPYQRARSAYYRTGDIPTGVIEERLRIIFGVQR